ncbi:putative glutamate receptor [Lasioglossum baleicum]|uniref:putative glutamate receptor n=1 Tax=Lasioglossum baleicum TaxID=434251 RepID=UPI003FCC4081
MNVVLPTIFFTFVACSAARTCIRFLRNAEEKMIFRTIPGQVFRWNRFAEAFEEIEAVTLNGTAVCSVKMADSLRGKTIVVATDIMHPYVTRKSDDASVSGFIGDIWTTLEEVLGFRTIYRKAGPSASQTLMNGQAHALLVATVIYSDTSGYYSYSTPITTSSYALFVRSDGTRVLQQWYTNVFSRGLWSTILAFTLATGVIIIGVHCLKRITRTSTEDDEQTKDEFSSASFGLLVVLGCLSGQGCHKMPTAWSLRLIVLSHLITGMLLAGGFSSTLTSYLAIRGNSVPLNSLEDALQKRSHSICVRNDSSAYIHFTVNRSPRGELKTEWRGLVNNRCPDMRDAARLNPRQLCEHGFAYLEVPDVFLPVYLKVRDACACRIVRTPGSYWRLKISFLHARFGEHRRLMDTYLMRLRSAGILKYLEAKWMPKGIKTDSEEDRSTFQPVEYAHVHLLLLGLVYATIFSAFVCVLENVCHTLGRVRLENPSSRK